eukprot:1757357-Ditylum_brightwellii.AAC.1
MINAASDVMRSSGAFEVLKDDNGEHNKALSVPFVLYYHMGFELQRSLQSNALLCLMVQHTIGK